jgi:hypothetical protein
MAASSALCRHRSGAHNSSIEIVDLATELKARGQGSIRIVVLGDGL